VVPGGGPMARLSRLVGRARALEILLVADDLDGPRAEQYGYVNRLIADDQLNAEAPSHTLTRSHCQTIASSARRGTIF
jgi:enoyl-CoA hydratase/carnithine racemase